MRVTVLGCGGSEGVPSATGSWGACDPDDPRNYRRRPGVLVETEDAAGDAKTILIDAPPELREQLVRARAHRIDGVLLTHGHADHLHGIDDLRPFARHTGAPIPLYAMRPVLDELERRFGYILPGGASYGYRPLVAPQETAPSFEAAGVRVQAFDVDHGFSRATGFRIGPLGYTIDAVRLPAEALDILRGIKLWIVDCQQLEPHPTHSHLEQTLRWIEWVRPERAILTHLGPRLDFATLAAMLPAGVEPGVDGLVVELKQERS